MAEKNIVDWIALVLVIIGGLNWMFFAFGYNLVDALLGKGSILAQLVYLLVGAAAVYMIYFAVSK
jgi:hypothetical protein